MVFGMLVRLVMPLVILLVNLPMIFSILGLATYRKEDQKGKGLAIASFVIWCILAVGALCLIGFVASMQYTPNDGFRYSIDLFALAMILLVFLVLPSIIVMCTVGIVKHDRNKERGLPMAVIGLIISFIMFGIMFVMFFY